MDQGNRRKGGMSQYIQNAVDLTVLWTRKVVAKSDKQVHSAMHVDSPEALLCSVW